MVDSPSKNLMSDEMEFEDTDSFKSGSNSFKDTVLNQFHKCTVEGSKEMVTGGVMKRVVEGKVIEFPVPNQIEIYINCVEVLRMILFQKVEGNSDVIGKRMEEFKKIKFELRKRKVDYKNSLITPEMYSQLSDDNYKKYMYQQLTEIDESYENERVENYKYLFETLCILIDHLKYFEEEKVTM